MLGVLHRLLTCSIRVLGCGLVLHLVMPSALACCMCAFCIILHMVLSASGCLVHAAHIHSHLGTCISGGSLQSRCIPSWQLWHPNIIVSSPWGRLQVIQWSLFVCHWVAVVSANDLSLVCPVVLSSFCFGFSYLFGMCCVASLHVWWPIWCGWC